ncbi:MAG: phosphohydrolase [Vulcanimicrobiota bacterium]
MLSSHRRTGDWFQTFTGVQFYPTEPRPEDFLIEDIAHALSHLCRFNGHTRHFYSVAQHSILVSEIVPPEFALEGLLHDAAEAYIGDMVRPAKVAMPDFQRIEKLIEEALAQAFGLRYPWPVEVKKADDRLLATERRDLLTVQRPWTFRAEPLETRIDPYPSGLAKVLFISRYKQLKGEISDR